MMSSLAKKSTNQVAFISRPSSTTRIFQKPTTRIERNFSPAGVSRTAWRHHTVVRHHLLQGGIADFRSISYEHPQLLLASEDALSTQDIVIGTVLAIALALLFSFLNGKSSSSEFVSWWNQKQTMENNKGSSVYGDNVGKSTGDNSKVFNANEWKEMTQPENYVLYSTRVKRRLAKQDERNRNIPEENKSKQTQPSISPRKQSFSEQKISSANLSLIGLLLLFVPLFSIEFFFALSRQFLCGDGPTPSLSTISFTASWAQELCSSASY